MTLQTNAKHTGSTIAISQILLNKEALSLLSPADVISQRIIPLGWDEGKLVIASSKVLDKSIIEQLKRKTGWDIKTFLTTENEIEQKLRQYYYPKTSQKTSPIRLNKIELIKSLKLVNSEILENSLKQEKTPHGSPWLDWLYDEGHITEHLFISLQATSLGLPHLRTLRFIGKPGLAQIIPESLALKHHIVPFYATTDHVWVYTPHDDPAQHVGDLLNHIGLEVLPIVITRALWDTACKNFYELSKNKINFQSNLKKTIVDSKYLNESQILEAQTQSSRTDLPLSTVIRQRGWLNEDQWLDINATNWNLEKGFSDESLLVNDFYDEFPKNICQQWGIVPLYEGSHVYHIGISNIKNHKYIAAVEAICNCQVQGHLLPQAQFDYYWRRFYSLKRDLPLNTLPPLGEWIVNGAYATPDQINEGQEHAVEEKIRLGESLIKHEWIDDIDLAEIISLQQNLPWLPIEYPPQSIKAPEIKNFKFSDDIIPLLIHQDETSRKNLVIVLSDPFIKIFDDPNGISTNDRFLNNDLTQISIFPIIVPDRAIAANKTLVNENDQVRGYLRYLTKIQLLSSTDVPLILDKHKSKHILLETILINDYLGSDSYFNTLSDFTNIPIRSLELKYSKESVIDSQGRVVDRTVVLDPVSINAARLISIEDAHRWNAIPIVIHNNNITIALSNPLNTEIQNEIIEDLKQYTLDWVIAPREEIFAAINRTLGRKNIGTYLLEAGIINVNQLREALQLSQHIGVRLGRALTVLRYASERELVTYLAEQQNIKSNDLSDLSIIDSDVVRLISDKDLRRLGAIPLYRNNETITIAMLDPLDELALEELKERLGSKIETVITTTIGFERALEYVNKEEYTYISTQELLFRYPEESAFKVLNTGQKIFFLLFLVGSLAWIIFNYVDYLIFINAITTFFYIAFSMHRFYLVYNALSHKLEMPVTQEEIDSLNDIDLPPYTVLVPLYKEAAVLPKLTWSLSNLDYPLAKLDIKLLMEEDDEETILAAKALKLPSSFQLVVIPNSEPKTKPKACNYGLIKAQGDYVVIFDAEDTPEPDQLKKMVVAFSKVDENVACIQAKLNYFNSRQNVLTRWFTTEYSMWFDLFLPGLDASGAPVPLGGTSNHFKRSSLENVGAWDPFNVTEDADLGVRLYKLGYKTAIVDTTTYEEANSKIFNWIRQRSRWVKGYIQTWLVHMRNPIKLWRNIGTRGFLGFNLTIGGTFLGFLLNPIYWILTAVWFLTEWQLIREIFPTIIFYLGAINLFIGNFAFTYMNIAGCMRRELFDLVKYALFSPIYWGLMSVGAWKGFIQLFTRPFYWEKTVHGLDRITMEYQPKKHEFKSLMEEENIEDFNR